MTLSVRRWINPRKDGGMKESINAELNQILSQFIADNEAHLEGNAPSDGYEEAKAKLKEVVMRALPEATSWEFRTTDEDEIWAEGYDQCLAVIKKSLSEIFGEA